jgi:hypothetical protein
MHAALQEDASPNPQLPSTQNVPALADFSELTANDPFDLALSPTVGPALSPVLDFIGRTPAISNAIASVFGVNTPAVSTQNGENLPLGMPSALHLPA